MRPITAAVGEAEPLERFVEREGMVGFCGQLLPDLMQEKLPEAAIGFNPRSVNFHVQAGGGRRGGGQGLQFP